MTPTDTNDPLPPEEVNIDPLDQGVETGAHMDPHGDEPQDDPLPEGIGDDEDQA